MKPMKTGTLVSALACVLVALLLAASTSVSSAADNTVTVTYNYLTVDSAQIPVKFSSVLTTSFNFTSISTTLTLRPSFRAAFS